MEDNKEKVFTATIEQVLSRTGSRGTISQVKVTLNGEKGRTLIRNVKGPVKKGDQIVLLEAEREARRLR